MSHLRRAAATVFVAVMSASGAAAAGLPAAGPAVITVGTSADAQRTSYDGVVEATRQTVLAVQVAGAIVEIDIKAGDRVKAGQTLMRVDARAAAQGTAATDAQVGASQAGLDVARRDWERQQKLFAKGYISQAALDRSEAQFKAAESQLTAQQALAAAARTQTGFFVLRAPYSGVIAEVPVSSGELALPGKPLAILYDPAALRVSAALPQSALATLRGSDGIEVELPGLPGGTRRIKPRAAHLMPVVDAATHTTELRLDLPSGLSSVSPGMFARAWLSGGKPVESAHLWIPSSAIVRRAELTAAYVLDSGAHPLLRQIRLGDTVGTQTEVLAGLTAGDRVIADPRALATPAAGQP